MAGAARERSRERILRATVDALSTRGYAATTARAIAAAGGFAPGVIYYHFDDLDALFVATARHTSGRRLERYRDRLAGVPARALAGRLRELYAEDTASGHVAAVRELIAAAVPGSPLAAELATQMRRWREFTEERVGDLLAGTPLAALLPAREVAAAVVALYLGMETLGRLDGDRDTPQALFDAVDRAAALADG